MGFQLLCENHGKMCSQIIGHTVLHFRWGLLLVSPKSISHGGHDPGSLTLVPGRVTIKTSDIKVAFLFGKSVALILHCAIQIKNSLFYCMYLYRIGTNIMKSKKKKNFSSDKNSVRIH